MRNCKTCGVEYQPTKNRSGLCLPCRRAHDKQWRATRKAAGNPVVTPKMPKEWHQAYGTDYYQRPEVKARLAEKASIRAADPIERHKHIARWKARRAIASGKLQKQPCWACGTTEVEAHHPDYSRPLDVVWLCRPHHRELHAKAGAA